MRLVVPIWGGLLLCFLQYSSSLGVVPLLARDVRVRQQTASLETVFLYLDTLEAAGRSPYTIADYRRRLIPFVHRFGGRGPTSLDVRDYLDTFRSTNHRSVTLVVLRQWFKFLTKRGLLDADPSEGIPIPRRMRRNYPPISAEEFARLLALLPEALRVLSFIFYRVGARLSEALAIKAEEVAIEPDGYGTIEFPKRKGEIDGFASFGPDVCSILGPFLQGKAGPLFHSMSRGYVGIRVKRAGRKAGIPGPMTPHRMRHAFINWAVEAGWNMLMLQAQLGHSSPLSTAWYFRPTRRGVLGAYRQAAFRPP